MQLQGKVALITGASSGIGKATAIKLAEAEVKVGLAARRAEKLESLKRQIESNGGEAKVLEMDVSNPADVNSKIAEFISVFGRVDILFNNAGVMPVSEIDQFKIDEWHAMVDTNLARVILFTQPQSFLCRCSVRDYAWKSARGTISVLPAYSPGL